MQPPVWKSPKGQAQPARSAARPVSSPATGTRLWLGGVFAVIAILAVLLLVVF